MGTVSKKIGGISALALGAAMMMAPPASAASTFDFTALANLLETDWDDRPDGNPVAGGEFVDSSDTWFVNGIGVIATAYATPAAAVESRAYLDSGNAGLGVCSIANCTGSSDDNAGLAGDLGTGGLETLKLSFVNSAGDAQKVAFGGIAFDDRDHNAHENDFLVGLKVDGGSQINWSIGDAIGAGTMFEFTRLAISAADTANGITDNQRDFYITSAVVSAVPLPAGLLLLGSALGGLGLMGRRRRKAD